MSKLRLLSPVLFVSGSNVACKPRLRLWPTLTWDCSGISSEKSKVLGIKGSETSGGFECQGFHNLDASDVPTQQSSGTPVELWFSCLYIVFGTWLIKPGESTFPFPSDALQKVFFWCVDWLVDLFVSFFFF